MVVLQLPAAVVVRCCGEADNGKESGRWIEKGVLWVLLLGRETKEEEKEASRFIAIVFVGAEANISSPEIK